jgi:hypothetical protein
VKLTKNGIGFAEPIPPSIPLPIPVNSWILQDLPPSGIEGLRTSVKIEKLFF